MSGQTIGPALPRSFVYSTLGSDQVTGGTAGVWQTMNFNTDVTSVLNGLIDRPTTSRFRALARGYYEISYTANAYPAANGRGGLFRVFKNGTTDIGLSSEVFGNASSSKAGSAAVMGVVELQANDYVELQANPHDGSALTVKTSSSFMLRLIVLI